MQVKYGINLQETMNNKSKTNTLTSNATVIQASKELKKVSQSLYFGIGRGNDSDNESGDNGSVENPLMKWETKSDGFRQTTCWLIV